MPRYSQNQSVALAGSGSGSLTFRTDRPRIVRSIILGATSTTLTIQMTADDRQQHGDPLDVSKQMTGLNGNVLPGGEGILWTPQKPITIDMTDGSGSANTVRVLVTADDLAEG